jgi:cell division septal protein FtsQ
MRPHRPAASRLASVRVARVREERAHRRARRIGSLALAALALAGLVALLVAPTFHVHRIEVSGNQRMTADQVVAAAGLQHPGSVFQVDPSDTERRLEVSTWVRAASVSALLPDRVSIHVDEWQPAAVYRAAGGGPWYLSDEAVVLGPVDGGAGGLLEVDGPAQPQPRTGRAAMDRALLVALVNIQRGLPGLIGQDVQSFTIDSCGNLTMNAAAGWKAQFGLVNTPEDLATLESKLAALKALVVSGGVDLRAAGYVNLMNPNAAAVPVPTPKPRPGRASPSQSPSPLPSPTPQPISPCA